MEDFYTRAQALLSALGHDCPAVVWTDTSVAPQQIYGEVFDGIYDLAWVCYDITLEFTEEFLAELDDGVRERIMSAHRRLQLSAEIVALRLRLDLTSYPRPDLRLAEAAWTAMYAASLASTLPEAVLVPADDAAHLAWTLLQAFVEYQSTGTHTEVRRAASGLDRLERSLVSRETGMLFQKVLPLMNFSFSGCGAFEAAATLRGTYLSLRCRLAPAERVALAALKGAFAEYAAPQLGKQGMFGPVEAADREVAILTYLPDELAALAGFLVKHGGYPNSMEARRRLLVEARISQGIWA